MGRDYTGETTQVAFWSSHPVVSSLVTWYPVHCAECVRDYGPEAAAVFRVDPTSGAVEVRRRTRRPGAKQRTRWIPLDAIRDTKMMSIVRCDHPEHAFIGGPARWRTEVADAAVDAMRIGAEYGVVAPDEDGREYAQTINSVGDGSVARQLDAMKTAWQDIRDMKTAARDVATRLSR